MSQRRKVENGVCLLHHPLLRVHATMHGSFVVLIVLQAVPCIVIICIIVNPCLGQWGRAWGSSIGTPIGNIALVWVVISMFRRYNASPHIQVAAEIVWC